MLVCARLDITDPLDAGEVERAMVRIGGGLRRRFPDIAKVFLEPVPRKDPEVRERVRARYGEDLAKRMEQEAGSRDT